VVCCAWGVRGGDAGYNAVGVVALSWRAAAGGGADEPRMRACKKPGWAAVDTER
jgi:hypothetical protein